MDTGGDGGGPRELFAQLAQHTPDIVLLDGEVVERDTDLLGELRGDQRWHDVRVIVTAPWASLEDGATALPWGADDCVSKPFRVPELLGRVRTQLRASSQLRAARSALRDTAAELERAREHAASNKRLVDILHEVTGELSATEIYRLLTRRVARALEISHCSVILARSGDETGTVAAAAEDPTIQDVEIVLVGVSRDQRRAGDGPPGARGGRVGAPAARGDARPAGARGTKRGHPVGRDGSVHDRPMAVGRAVPADERRRARR